MEKKSENQNVDIKEIYVELQKIEEEIAWIHQSVFELDSAITKLKAALKRGLGK